MATTLSQPSFSINARALIASGTFPLLQSTITHQPTTSGLGAGSTAGNVDRVIQQTLAITSGTPVTINVGTALDPFGTAAAMVHVSLILVESLSTTAGQDFTVGGGTHPVCGSDQLTVQANGGVGILYNPNLGYAVTGSSADVLTITVAAGTAVAGRVTIFGRSS